MEHYTISRDGNRLLLDSDGNQHWFIIATDNDFKGWYETAEFADADNSLTNALHNKTHMPVLFGNDELQISPKRWCEYLQKAKPITTGEQQYYYSFTKQNKHDTNNITSFYDYRKTHNVNHD